ncbi:hypothetical protein D918_07933 [Trichuris suis]|nr:hypothetical protein D918_07933 [Trichuris suis]
MATCAFINAQFTLPKSYPVLPPRIEIMEVSGLSLSLTKVLQCKLEDTVREKQGQVRNCFCVIVFLFFPYLEMYPNVAAM